MRKYILLASVFIASILFYNILKEENPCAIKGRTFANVEALAFSEGDMGNKSETKVEEEESWDYAEARGECLFYYTMTTITTFCYGIGRIDCIMEEKVGESELINIVCPN